MKRLPFKALLIISVLTVVVGYTDVHTLQSVYAQGSAQITTQNSTPSSPSDSNQSRDSQNWSIPLITALVSTNVTLAIALGGGFTWVFLQYKDGLKNYKKELKDLNEIRIQQGLKEQELEFKNQLNAKEVEFQKKIKEQELNFQKSSSDKDEEIKSLKINLENLQRDYRHLNLDAEFQVEEYFSNLDNILKKIEYTLPKLKNKQSQQYKQLVSQSTGIAKKLENLTGSIDQDSINKYHDLTKEKSEIDYAKTTLEKQLSETRTLLQFIPQIQIINQEIIRRLLAKPAIILNEEKISIDAVLKILKGGCQKVEDYEKQERLTPFDAIRKGIAQQGR